MRIDPPHAAKGNTVWPVERHVALWPPAPGVAARTVLLDGPYEERGEAEYRLLRRVGAFSR